MADFEFRPVHGGRPEVVCMCARELRSRKTLRLWIDDLRHHNRPPFQTGADALFIAYAANAEFDCFLQLGWNTPDNVLDLRAEFLQHINGDDFRRAPHGTSLIGALLAFGLPNIGTAVKDHWRDRVIKGGPWSADDRENILNYCLSDIDALESLLGAMWPMIDIDYAVQRGRYMSAVSKIERCGVPIDEDTYELISTKWDLIKGRLIKRVDKRYGVFDGERFDSRRFDRMLEKHRIPWPRLPSGKLDLKEKTFRERSKAFPWLSDLRELRYELGQMRTNALTIGPDGRNRVWCNPFGSLTGRNQPSSTKNIFGNAVWKRRLIVAPPGYRLVHLDWSQQEFAVAAALSGDLNMLAAYVSGDCYMHAAITAGLAPPGATKATHAGIRDQMKTTTLGTQYGMEAAALAQLLGVPEIVARNLLRSHRETFPQYWKMSDDVALHFQAKGDIRTVFGWHLRNGLLKPRRKMDDDDGGDARGPRRVSERTTRNFVMQANGSEMMRIAACMLTENGIEVAASVHDAFLILAPAADLEDVTRHAQALMAAASRAICGDLELRTDVKVYTRYEDPTRGAGMWETVMDLLGRNPTDPRKCTRQKR